MYRLSALNRSFQGRVRARWVHLAPDVQRARSQAQLSGSRAHPDDCILAAYV